MVAIFCQAATTNEEQYIDLRVMSLSNWLFKGVLTFTIVHLFYFSKTISDRKY